ncbi:FkbM family methyltransferase [uncultured Helicobacter sp.]|uniref:FkbM family methyltransferase n=2 Tax=uncultured Helicobacter sp. TaxID=175537 RepID=UPI00260E3453|nr:FkbM family methyltransferase [uncultured Helicobacter sp.]
MIDCGAYDGDTCLEFVRYVPEYEKIYALEPDSKLVPQLIENTKHLRCEVIPKGASHTKEIIYFAEENSGTSRISENNGIALECDSIDNILKTNSMNMGGGHKNNSKPVSFIKMDIEGGELNALKGAKETITTYRPKLAICMYHRREDFITLPQFILSLNPHYKLYLRNRNPLAEDTILFAINDT